MRTFALKNRAALHQANKRLENDASFYEDVHREYGKEPEPESWWPFNFGGGEQ